MRKHNFLTVRGFTDELLELPSERKKVDCVAAERLISVASKVMIELLHSQRYSFVKRYQRSLLKRKRRSSLLSASPTRLREAERRLKLFSIRLRRFLMASNQTGDIGDLAIVKKDDLLRLIKLAPRVFWLSESSKHLSREALVRSEELERGLEELNLLSHKVLGKTKELERELEELNSVTEKLDYWGNYFYDCSNSIRIRL